MKKRILSMLLALTLCMSLLPMGAMAATSANVNVWVGGVQMQEGKYLASGSTSLADTAPTSGGYAYMKGSTTLELNGYISGTNGSDVKIDNYNTWSASIRSNLAYDSTLTIELVGNNKITNESTLTNSGGQNGTGIWAQNGNIKVTGTGALTIKTTASAIYAKNGKIELNGTGKMNIATNYQQQRSIYAKEDITISQAELNISSWNGSIFSNNGNIIINGGTLFVQRGSPFFEVTSGHKIQVNSGTLKGEVQSGFSMFVGSHEFAGPYWWRHTKDGEYTNGDYSNISNRNYAEITTVQPPHSHGKWAYTVNTSGNILTATCGNSGCDSTAYTETLTINKPELTTYGGDGRANATLTSSNTESTFAGSALPSIVYKIVNQSQFSDAPQNAGNYRAEVAVAGQTIYVDYTIAKAATEHNLETAPAINYTNETIATTDGMEYSIDGETTWTRCGTNMSVTAFGWNGSNEVTVKFRAYNDENHQESAQVQEVTIPARPATPVASSFTVTKPTAVGGKDGKLSNITNEMEYKTSNGNWISGTGAEITNITDGTKYTIRSKATETAFASGSVEVTVAAKIVKEITGISAATGQVYDNSAKIGYTGTPSVDAYTDSFVYTYYLADGTTKTTADNSGAASEGAAPKYAGSYKLIVSIPADNTDYTGSTTVNFTIDPKPIAAPTADSTEFTYNGKEHTYSLDANDAYTVTGNKQTNANEGGQTVTVALKDKQNTVWSTGGTDDKTFNFVIKKATITITAADKTAYVGDAAPAFEVPELNKDYTITGLAENEELSGELTLTCEADMTKADTYAIVPAGVTAPGGDANYNLIQFVNGTLTVSEKSSGSGGGSSRPVTTTTTEKNEDGSTTITVTNRVTGVVIETIQYPDGSALVTTTQKDGTETTQVKVPSGQSVEVSLPQEAITPGTVAVLVKEDGTREIIRKTAIAEGKVVVPLSVSGTLEILDNGKTFVDTLNHWAQDQISFVTARELYVGTTDTTFTPDGSMTRGMLARVLHNLENNPGHAYAGLFPDLMAGHWAQDSIYWAADQGIVGGYPDGSFGADENISRQQLAVMLWRYCGQPASSHDLSHFVDGDLIGEYARLALAWANEQGIVTGKEGSRLDPEGQATRAEVATMLMRMMTP